MSTNVTSVFDIKTIENAPEASKKALIDAKKRMDLKQIYQD